MKVNTILSISGIFSGTPLGYSCNLMAQCLSVSWWNKRQQGLTEPDPRIDLSGQDVMRKLVILAREAGYDIEPNSRLNL